MLKDQFNIIIMHQVPRSSYTNLLDFGVWCNLQFRVEKQDYQKSTDVHKLLAESIMNTWNNDKKLSNVNNRVWKRLRNILALIVEGKSGNNLAETKKGKQFRNLEILPDFLETM